MLVRDVTSGVFAPRYSPYYRIVAIHGPNRIVVRDEKGNESVRRASHLKVYDPKEKVAAMIPEQSEYNTFGRSTKLLLHPKDVPDLQFTSKTEERGKIPPNIEVSAMELSIDSKIQETVNRLDLMDSCGEIPPKIEKAVRTQIVNSNEQYIAEYTSDVRKYSEIPPETAASGETGKTYENYTWFRNPVNCISKWSKALKLGAINYGG